MSKRIKVTRPERLSRIPMREADESLKLNFSAMESLPIEYDVNGPIKSMVNLTDEMLREWVAVNHNLNKKGAEALDELYEICSVKH